MGLENQIDVLKDIASGIKQILAVHDEKITQQERKQDDIFELIEQRRHEMSEDIKELHSRITSVQRELGNDISQTENRIMRGIEDLKSELKIDQKYHNEKQKTLDERISALEKWRYMLVGAGIVGGYMLTKFLPLIEISVK
jgi:septal ring factor EnvC (AmiA/AmiB activator)